MRSLGPAVIVFSLAAGAGLAQDPPLVPIDQLGLAVKSAKVVPEVKGIMGNKLSAKAGSKLVVVTVAGNAEATCRFELLPSDFSAAHGAPARKSAAGGVAIDGMWLFAEGVQYAQTVTLPKPGPVSLEVAISVPENVTAFAVHYRDKTLGRATLPPKP
jgi:hypothetical protein